MSEPLLARTVRLATVAIALIAGIVIGSSALMLWPAADMDGWATHAGIAAGIGALAIACFCAAVYGLRARASVTLPQATRRS
jgi:hypothetical protein